MEENTRGMIIIMINHGLFGEKSEVIKELKRLEVSLGLNNFEGQDTKESKIKR